MKQSISSLAKQLQIEVKSDQSDQEKFDALVHHIEHLVNTDFNKLLSILYRIDVSEEKLKKALANNEGDSSTAHIIAQLMMERQIEKIKFKSKYNGS